MDRASTGDTRRDDARTVQFYDTDAILIREIGHAMCVALTQGNAVVSISTGTHRRQLERHLAANAIDIAAAQNRGQYASLNAADTVSKITVDGVPDVIRFAEILGAVVDRMAAQYPRVWIFGEMVAAMSAEGDFSGALELERLWRAFTESRPVFLYCAYPTSKFSSADDLDAFLRLCEEHCRILHSERSLALAVERKPRPKQSARKDAAADKSSSGEGFA